MPIMIKQLGKKWILALPSDGTEYLVVSLKAKKHGPSALTANKHDFR